MPNSAPQMRVAFASMASNTGLSSPGELEMTRSTSEVAVCCSSASASFFFRSALAARRRSTRVLAFVVFKRRLGMRLRLFAPLRDKVTSSAQSRSPFGRASQGSSRPTLTESHDELVPFHSISSPLLFAQRSRGSRGSPRPDVGRANDLGPLVSFMCDQLAEFGGRKHKRRASQFGESRLYFEIGEASVDLLVENADDLGRRVLGCPNTNESARFIAG